MGLGELPHCGLSHRSHLCQLSHSRSALDFRLMREDRGWFCFSGVEVKVQLTPPMHGIVDLLPNPRALRDLLLTGKKIGGREAAELGIVDRVCLQETLLEKSMELAKVWQKRIEPLTGPSRDACAGGLHLRLSRDSHRQCRSDRFLFNEGHNGHREGVPSSGDDRIRNMAARFEKCARKRCNPCSMWKPTYREPASHCKATWCRDFGANRNHFILKNEPEADLKMGINDFTIYDAVNRSAACFGEKEAWFEAQDGRTLTFAQYKASVDRLALGLTELGVTKGDRIGVHSKNSLEFFLLYGAAAAVGAIMLPINWRLSSEEIAFVINDCEPAVLFFGEEYQELVEGIRSGLPSVKEYVKLGNAGGNFRDFASLLDNSGDFASPDVSIDDGFVIIHTAAVTGNPRGALLSHGNMLCAHMHFMSQLGISSGDVHLNQLPLFHVGGLVMTTTSLHAGALSVNMSKFDAEAAVRLIEDKKVSYMFEFAPILGSILERQEKGGHDITSLRAVMGLDTAATIEKYQEVSGGTFYCMYAQTETSCLGTFVPYNDKPGSAGKTVEMAHVTLVDDDDKPVSTGEVGEITVRGPMVFRGYWNLPEDNAFVFRNGRHHTGDMGRFDEGGFLWYEGRKAEKELIKPGGENVYPAEVEKVIMLHPAVEKVVVFGVPHPKWKEGIKAVCLVKDDDRIAPEELIEFVGARIARFKKPHFVEFVKELPLKDNGSVDRERTRAVYGSSRQA